MCSNINKKHEHFIEKISNNIVDDDDGSTESNAKFKTKIINFDQENLADMINNFSIDTCKKCKVSVDVRNLLKHILENLKMCKDSPNNGSHINGCDDSSHQPNSSDFKKCCEDDNFIYYHLNRQNNSKETKSIGTQHDYSDTNTNDKNVVVITDKFKKKCLEHNFNVVSCKASSKKDKKSHSKSLEDLLSITNNSGIDQVITTTTTKTNNEKLSTNKDNKKILTSRSKSVDDISTSSNDVIEGVDSVELIFISDEFLNKAKTPEVIIINEPFPINKHLQPSSISPQEALSYGNNNKNNKSSNKRSPKEKSPRSKKLYVISDDFKNKSLNNTVIIVKQKDSNKVSSKATSPNECVALNLKTTATHSNSFIAYDEPWSPVDDLENKGLGEN